MEIFPGIEPQDHIDEAPEDRREGEMICFDAVGYPGDRPAFQSVLRTTQNRVPYLFITAEWFFGFFHFF